MKAITKKDLYYIGSFMFVLGLFGGLAIGVAKWF